jgi:CDP-glycerol glycerophosphotransferase (TagB/SpsB family)
MNPFNKGLAFLYDYRCNPQFVFLQHGVIHNHHTKAMCRYERNFCGFVTSAKKEYDYISSPFYQYSSKEVWLTGLPRFDRLYHDEKKVVTIMPTWRSWLTVHLYDEKLKTKVWSVNPDFTESDYFKFYHGLINHPRLIEAAQECGYQICFLPHVNFFSCAKLFTHPESVHVHAEEVSYRKVFAESNLIVTDYSSAIFDFAYLHKPVIYCQFDKDEFYSKHTVKKGYFDFERDGFGPVTYDLEDCVEQIIKYIRNDCKLDTKYETRINEFFAFNDRNCCERVYRHILEARQRKKPLLITETAGMSNMIYGDGGEDELRDQYRLPAEDSKC